MKSTILKLAVSAALVAGASPAFAELVYQPGVERPGTGLGAVTTVTTGQDNNSGPNQNGTESACVTYDGGDFNAPNYLPSFACELGLQGGDNQSSVAGNNVYQLSLLSEIVGLESAGELGVVLNVSESGNEFPATLTDLYLSLYDLSGNLLETFAYEGPDLDLGDAGGIGQSGDHVFTLDAIQAALANETCPDLTQCILGGGFQFLANTTDSTPETMYVAAFEEPGNPGEVPEPGSVALLGRGALGMGALRRRYAAKK